MARQRAVPENRYTVHNCTIKKDFYIHNPVFKLGEYISTFESTVNFYLAVKGLPQGSDNKPMDMLAF